MLKVSNLTKKNPRITILDQVSFTARKGEITAIIGPSGSGKTTILRCLAQLEKFESGYIEFEGKPISQLPKGSAGFVFQSFQLFPHFSVLDNLTFSPTLQNKGTAEEIKEKAMTLLKKVDLEKRANTFPRQLSGGQRQRIAIARALMLDPPIMLFDEPTSALDLEMVNEIATLIKATVTSERVVLLVTHEIRLAKKIADKVIFLDHGKVLDELSHEDFFNKDPGSKLSPRAKQFLNNLDD